MSFAQSTSSQGKEFWTAYMSHIEDNGDSQMALYVTGDEATEVTLEVADNSFTPITKQVVPGQVTIIDVPKIVFLENAGKFLQKGLHITAGKKVAVFAHIYAKSVSGATLLLPVQVLGKEYYSLNYTQNSNAEANAFSTFMIVATEDHTQVEITLSQGLADGTPAGTVLHVSLNKGDVYQAFSFSDFTNTKIRSVSSAGGECKKIAVFSGSTKIGIGCNDGVSNHFTSDNLFQQVYPTASWGKNYISVPLKNRNYDIYRVVFSEPNTQLTINGQVIPQANYQTPFYYQFEGDRTNYITASKPVQVIQYAVSQGNELSNGCHYVNGDKGDPEMIYLNPLEQTLDHITLYSTDRFQITSNYVNVVIRTDKKGTFKVDGQGYANFTPIPGNPQYAYAQISVRAGAHTLTAGDGFSAIAYGFGEAESYGYSAGANLKNLNENIVFTPLQGSGTLLDGCKEEFYHLRLTVPFQPTKIVWNFKGERPNYTDASPVLKGTATGSNGQTLYQYEYVSPVAFQLGDHSVTATATNPLADACGSDVDIDFDFNIAERPHPSFITDDNLCSAKDIAITAQYADEVTKVRVWWDFLNHPDDFEDFNKNQLPADKKYHHRYTLSTTDLQFDIRLEAFTGATFACSDAVENLVTVKGGAEVAFANVAPMCADAGPVQLIANNNGFAGSGVFSGTAVTPESRFDPAVSGAGTFTITYTFTRENSCDATYTQDIVVNPLPEVNSGKVVRTLEGESIVLPAKATGEGLTYNWEPSKWLNDPTALNPVCSALEDITYRLTVTSGAGCVNYDDLLVKVLRKPVVVNAFTPNGDGINDTWTIKFLETYPGNTVDIYNRQGEKVYSSVGYAIPWDGTANGKLLPAGTYYYIINPKNGRERIAGNVIILR